MQRARLDGLLEKLVSLDTETHKVQPGLLAPPLVLGSVAQYVQGQGIRGKLLDKPTLREFFPKLLASDRVIGGANIAYDMLVMAVDAAKRGIDLMPLIFKAYEEERVIDLQIWQALDAIANGTLNLDPRTRLPLRDPITNKIGRYSLAICTDLVLGRSNAKANDKYRESYALFDDWPIEMLPDEARVYPVDDAINTHEIILAQAGLIERPGPHVWPSGGPGSEDRCRVCGCSVYDASKACSPRKFRSRNWHDLAKQCYTHFAMHLGAAWGFVVDQDNVDTVEKRVLAGRVEGAKPFFDLGWFRWKREKGQLKRAKVQAPIKRAVALAYGATGTCSFCNGEGKQPSPGATARTCGKKCGGPTCALCKGTGKRWSKLRTCKPCDGTGLVLETAEVPRTKGGKCKVCEGAGRTDDGECEECEGDGIMQGVAMGRDELFESGDEQLMNLSEFGEQDKIPETYIPWLREARISMGLDPEFAGLIPIEVYRNIPLCLRPNVLLETGRTSYNGVVQLLPRKGGIRECIVARPGKVLCSVDYESGELITHGQSCIWLVGYSELAKALNAGVKVHNAFAATVLGIAYDDFMVRFAQGETLLKDVRQAAKPANFGYPGRMGAAKLVIQQRKQGPDTVCERGSTWVIDDEATEAAQKLDPNAEPIKRRGYKGLRFCVVMDGAKQCGAFDDGTPNKVSEWKGRPLNAIVCKHCIECAERLRGKWLEQWPENEEYFEKVSEFEEYGQPLTEEQARVLLTDEEFEYQNGHWHLAPGEIVQHVSWRVRGGKITADSVGNAIANGFFQGLLADATKSALRRVIREMYDSTFRMPDGSVSPLYGSRFILFAHDELIAELPEATAHEAAMRLSAVMVEELRRYCPDLAKACFAEPALMRRWWKGATPWYRDGGKKPANANDRLVPWDDRKMYPGPQKKAA